MANEIVLVFIAVVLFAEFCEIRRDPGFVIACEALILRCAVVGEIISFGEYLTNRLQIFEAEFVAGRYEMSFIPFVPVIDHDDLFAPSAIGQGIGNGFHAL